MKTKREKWEIYSGVYIEANTWTQKTVFFRLSVMEKYKSYLELVLFAFLPNTVRCICSDYPLFSLETF